MRQRDAANVEHRSGPCDSRPVAPDREGRAIGLWSKPRETVFDRTRFQSALRHRLGVRERPCAVQDLRARAIPAHGAGPAGMTGRQLGVLPSQPPSSCIGELAPAKRGAGTEETRRSRVSWGEVLQSDDRKDRRDLSISAVLAIFMIPRRRASNWPLVQAEVGRSRERRWPSPWRRRHASRASTGGWKERCNLNWTVVQAAPRGSR